MYYVTETINSTIRLINHTEHDTRVQRSSNSNTSIKNEMSIKHDPPQVSEKELKSTLKIPPKKSQKGIFTKDVYDAGHTIPNAELCPDLGRNMKLMVLITSSPDHSEPRMAIRQTWGHFGQRKDIGIAFVVGIAKTDQMNNAIQSEMDMYGDIIQSRFIDHYDNLTLKTVSIFEWVDNYCSEVPFMLKTDDDMFINIPKLLSLTDKQQNVKRTIFGRLARKWKPIRNSSSKYYVSTTQYPQSFFPDFTTGPAYLVSKDSLHDLFVNSLNATYLKLEDVFMTGVVAQNISVKRIHVTEFFNKRIPFNVCNIRKSISIHMVKFHEQFILWEKLHDTRIRCK